MAARKTRRPAIDLNPIDDLIDLGEYVVKETVRAVKGNKRPSDSSRGAGLRSSTERSVRKIGTTTKRAVEETGKWTVGDPSKGWKDVVATTTMNVFPYGKAAKGVGKVVKGAKKGSKAAKRAKRAKDAAPVVSPTGKPVGKVAKTRPEPRNRGTYRPEGSLIRNESDARGATSQANRMLRRSGSQPAPSRRPDDPRKGISDSVGSVPKRSKSQPIGRSGQYEADEAMRKGRTQPKKQTRDSKYSKKKK